jgi:monoamine oxidase
VSVAPLEIERGFLTETEGILARAAMGWVRVPLGPEPGKGWTSWPIGLAGDKLESARVSLRPPEPSPAPSDASLDLFSPRLPQRVAAPPRAVPPLLPEPTMARTPLFRVLKRTLHRARLEGRDELPLASTPGATKGAPAGGATPPSSRIVTRRDFIRTSATAALGVGIVGCGGWGRGGTDAEVVIVGAGIAGLTVGWRLAQAGVNVRILEAQERVGGRMFTLRGHFPDDQVAELGGELIDTNHRAIRELAAELGIEMDDLQDFETLEPEVWYFGGRRIGEADLLQAWGPVAARIESELAALPLPDSWPWITWDAPAGAEALDRVSLAEWLEGVEMEDWFRRLLDVGFTSEYGLEAGEQSVLNLHTLVDTDPDAFFIYGEGDVRFHVQGGNDRIPLTLAERLEPVIERGVRLESVRQGSDGRYELSVRRGGSSRTVRAVHLVLALPFTLLRDVELALELPEVKRRAIAELGYGTNAKLMMGFEGRPWRTQHGAAGTVITDLPFQVTWETSRAQPGDGGILTNFTGGDAGMALGVGTAEERSRAVVAEFARVFPGVEAVHDPARAVRFHWPTHDWTRGSYSCYRPGQWTGLAGAEGMAVGRLHFAGEHTSLDAQGFMEGGCESGERVAREILQVLGRRTAA